MQYSYAILYTPDFKTSNGWVYLSIVIRKSDKFRPSVSAESIICVLYFSGMPFKTSCLPLLDRFDCCCCSCSLKNATVALGWMQAVSLCDPCTLTYRSSSIGLVPCIELRRVSGDMYLVSALVVFPAVVL